MRKSVSVYSETKSALRQIRKGQPYSTTIAALAGRWANRQRPVDQKSVAETTAIKVSEDCHSVLTDMKDRMGVGSVADVLAALVANWHV